MTWRPDTPMVLNSGTPMNTENGKMNTE